MGRNKGRNKLPFEIRVEYCKSVDIYQQIQNFEFGFITDEEFIIKVKEIKNKYSKIKETDPLLPPKK